MDIYNVAITAALGPPAREINPQDTNYSFYLGDLELEVDPPGLRYAGLELGDLVPAARIGVRGLRNRYRQSGIGAPFLAKAISQEADTLPLSSARVTVQMRVAVTVFIRYADLTNGLRSGVFRGRFEIYKRSTPLNPTQKRFRNSGASCSKSSDISNSCSSRFLGVGCAESTAGAVLISAGT